MKRKKHGPEQIIRKLREAEGPEDCAVSPLDNILDFKAEFASAQPSGTPFPGYGVYLPFIGDYFAWRDPNRSPRPTAMTRCE